MKDLVVILEDVIGSLADLSECLSNADINIEGIFQTVCEGKVFVHLFLEDAYLSRRILEGTDIQIKEELEVITLECKNHPGEISRITRKIASIGVNINLITIVSKNRMVLGVDNLDKTKNALKFDPLYFKEFIKSDH